MESQVQGQSQNRVVVRSAEPSSVDFKAAQGAELKDVQEKLQGHKLPLKYNF